MTPDEALAVLRARWSQPPLDRRDVEERIALRLRDQEGPEVLVLEMAIPTSAGCARSVAPRLFVASASGWRSRYVHTIADVDHALDALLARCA